MPWTQQPRQRAHTASPRFDPQQLAELHLLEAAIGGQSILDYMPRISPVMPGGVRGIAPQHLLPIAEQLALAEYQPVKLLVSIPPRHGKTELILHFIAWWLQRHPEHTIAYVTYNGEVAGGKSIRARDIALASGVQLRGDQWKAAEWRTLSGGGVLASGIGGSLTSFGANIVIIDDPIKNREEAESPTYRQGVHEWFTSTALSRVTPGGSIVIVHTRWHPDDLIGRLAKKGGWEVINLPAEQQDGSYLWPEGGWTKDVLLPRREEMGEYDWWSLYQGQPRPRGGQLFEEPEYYDKPTLLGASIFMACDPAATAKTHADYSVIMVGSCWIDPKDKLPHIDIIDVHRAQVEIPRLVQLLAHYQGQWGAPVGVEAVAGFKAIPQQLRQIVKGVRIIDVPAVKDKFTRALPVSAAWNGLRDAQGVRRCRIRVPRQAPWLGKFLEEMTAFTGIADKHDDQVDALAHLYWMAATLLGARKVQKASELARYLPFG